MIMFALSAKSLFGFMEMQTESIVLINAISRTGLEVKNDGKVRKELRRKRSFCACV